MCGPGTGAKLQLSCPNGYFCPVGTSVYSQFDFSCEEGFYCPTGTREATKNSNKCPLGYYCPPGTGYYDFNLKPGDYSQRKNDALTRCPPGTGLDELDTKTSLLECFINSEY